ncbi:sulfate/molybdate ABC transporter ATP-binding protein [Arthrobacter sp. HLT1-21]
MRLVADVRVAARGLNLQLTVESGETVAILGPNGAGKSTLLAVLAGLLRPDGGSAALGDTVLFDDTSWRPPYDRGVSLLAQEPLLFPHLSVLDNVAFGPRSQGTGRAASRTEAMRWLREVEAVEFADRRPSELSGGQAQRVAVARALATDPRLLLLDEPMAALDIAVTPAMRRTLRRVLTGRSAIIVTHNVLDALMLADRTIIVEAGAVVEMGPTREVLERPRSAFGAGLAGLNLVTGVSIEGGLETTAGLRLSALAEVPLGLAQEAAAVFSPRAVSVFVVQPSGSPRNVLPVTITDLEQRGELISVRAGQLSADITAAAAADLDLIPGLRVFFVVKSTEVTLYPR